PVHEGSNQNLSHVVVETTTSNIKIAEFQKINVFLNDEPLNPNFYNEKNKGKVFTGFQQKVEEGNTLTVEKLVSLFTSKEDDVEDPVKAGENTIMSINSFEEILEQSSKSWEEIWKEIDIELEGDTFSQKLLRLHFYHLMCTTSPNSTKNDAGIPARGLHGEAYRGHIFWDEIYLFQLYNMHYPDVAKAVLMYRYRRLNKAKEYAKHYGYEGSMWPWQSGSDGGEETQILHLNPFSGEWGPDYSSLQRHISIAVGYSVWEYIWTTKDQNFMENEGGEMLLEVCRFWASHTSFDKKTGKYSISNVMGPDEFHEKYPGAEQGGLKDNAYTNIMVVWLLKKAFLLLSMISEEKKNNLEKKINLTEKEIERWKEISHKMNIIISDEGIISQFDGYFDLKELDWDGYKKKYDNIYRMDRILKAEGKSPDDYKVAKQADTLMVFYNLDISEVDSILAELGYNPPPGYVQKNLKYYLQRTSHGSTLSRVVHAYLAGMIGEDKLGWELYSDALASDFNDIQGGTTGEGIHCGVMGGTILIAITAYGGINFRSEYLKINPNLPEKWKKLKFNFSFRENHYYCEIKKGTIKLKYIGSKDKNNIIYIGDKSHEIVDGKEYEFNY
ncbi:MAG: glycosyl hydrolase family 65 protein, partial [bacterium]